MDKIWVNRLIAGDKIWDNVPANRKNTVKAVLAQRVADGIIDEERYEEITGETYKEA